MPQPHPHPHASSPVLDEEDTPAIGPSLEIGGILQDLREEEQSYRKQQKESDNSRARSKAAAFENRLRDAYADQPDFFLWDDNRALNRLDFDYLFLHRAHFHSSIQTCLEIVASKITHERQDGEDGYFKKLETNIGWAAHITPIIFSQAWSRDPLVRCGLWSHAKNSRRCHKTDLCALCLWNDLLKVLVEAYGERSGAFQRAPAWWFFTLGFTTNPNNSKCQVKGFGEHGRKNSDENRCYEPYPVPLGPTKDADGEPYEGYDDALFLGLVVQEALDELYQSRIVDGYRNKLEGAFSLGPGGGNRMNMHGHCVANGQETDPDFIAERLFTLMQAGLK